MPHAVLPGFSPNRILVPLDFSLSAVAALHAAADLAKHFSALLYLVHIIPMLPVVTGTEFFPEEQFLQNAQEQATRQLSHHVAQLAEKGVKAIYSVEVGNDVPGNIMEVIDRERIDLIVISTHGISGWHPLFFGSIAEKVVKLVQIPILLLRSIQDPPLPIKSS